VGVGVVKEHPWVVDLNMLTKQGMGTLLSVSAVIYKRIPVFVVCINASFISIPNSPPNNWFA